jgi:hypothetical protein
MELLSLSISRFPKRSFKRKRKNWKEKLSFRFDTINIMIPFSQEKNRWNWGFPSTTEGSSRMVEGNAGDMGR